VKKEKGKKHIFYLSTFGNNFLKVSRSLDVVKHGGVIIVGPKRLQDRSMLNSVPVLGIDPDKSYRTLRRH
jgi:hypothetical protein